MSERLNIRDPVAALCALTGFEPKDVLHIDIEPAKLTVDVCLVNGYGSKYIDTETGFVAQETHTFEVLT
jgi:hypothetical protein